MVPTHTRSGEAGSRRPDGSVHYPDGTVASVDSETGETIIKKPDGSETRSPGRHTGQSNGGNTSERNNNSSNDSGNENDSNNDSDTDSNDDSNDDNGSDSQDDSSSDDSSDDGGSDDSGSEGESSDEMRGSDTGSSYNQPDAKNTADNFIARKTGETNEVESTAPENCDDSDSNGGLGPAGQPGHGGEQGCVPSMSSNEEEESDQPSVRVEDNLPQNNQSTGLGPESVINPTGFEEPDASSERTFEDIMEDIGGAVNPGR